MALATPTSSTVNAPSFATDGFTGNLVATNISTNLAWLVELRCISNILNPGSAVVTDLNTMRADELNTIQTNIGVF